MDLINVESSMIKAAGYDAATRVLEVVFHRGKTRTYHYHDVPPEVFQRLLAADSKGQFMHAAVSDTYAVTKVAGRRRR